MDKHWLEEVTKVHLTGSTMICHLWTLFYVMEDNDANVPYGFILFSFQEEFSEACQFCGSFDIDTLELYIDGFDYLVFFGQAEFEACIFFCSISDFEIEKYIIH